MHRYHYIEITVPDEFVVTVDRVPEDETDSRAMGDRLLSPDGELAFTVPSRVNPLEYNIILNPSHMQFEELTFGDPRPFPMDERLLK